MNRKKQILFLILGSLLLALSTLFSLSSKVVLALTAAGVLFFIWAMMLLIRTKGDRLRRLCIFLLLVLLFNGICGLWLQGNDLILNTPESHFFNRLDARARNAADGLYFSFLSFTQLGSTELIPANRTSRAITLLISLSGYLGLVFLLLTLQSTGKD